VPAVLGGDLEVQRGPSPAGVGVVHEVVVDERESVQQFQRRARLPQQGPGVLPGDGVAPVAEPRP
jgi:hypothetical protein